MRFIIYILFMLINLLFLALESAAWAQYITIASMIGIFCIAVVDAVATIRSK